MKGEYFPEVMYLLEIELQANFALRALENVRKGLPWWQFHEKDPAEHSAPVELIPLAHSFLTHAACVSRLLFVGDRGDKGSRGKRRKRRCARLRYLLGVRKRPALETLSLRHAWEHMDDRLDKVFAEWDGSKLMVSQMNFIEVDPTKPQLVLRGVNSKEERLYFDKLEVDIRQLERELLDIQNRLTKAFRKLEEEKLNPLFRKKTLLTT